MLIDEPSIPLECAITFIVKEPQELSFLIADRPSPNDSIEVAQKKLSEHRQHVQKIVYYNNLSALEEIKNLCDFNDFEVSTISSTIRIKTEKSNITLDLLTKCNELLNKNSYIDQIFISEAIDYDNKTQELANTFPRINVETMINAGTFTGEGVTIGIVEAAGVAQLNTYSGTNSNNNDYTDRDVRIRPGHTGNSTHADAVTMIAAGNNGIARGSNILSSLATDGPNNYFGWMIDEGANIINTSFGAGNDTTHGTYTSQAIIADQIIRQNLVTIVGSAGNTNTSPQRRITSPKTAFNYITVGNSATSTTTLHNSSCFREQPGYGASKPNLVAPGSLSTNAQTGNGTSFASPQVAGALALLMEEFPYLVAYPELNLAIVTASASPMSANYNSSSSDSESTFDASGLHNQIGSGLLNYEKMREAANNCISITRPANSSEGTIGQTIEFNAVKNQRVRASLAWLAAGVTSNNFTNYDLYLHRINTNGTYTLLKHIDGATNNVEFLDYTFGNDGTFRLSIQQQTTNSRTDYIALSYVLINESDGGSRSGGVVGHTCANYNEWTGSNSIHYIRCSCGYSAPESHSKYVVGNWEYCYYCTYSRNLSSHTHSYGAPYIPIPPTHNFDIRRHYATCDCGDVIIRQCIAFAPEPGEIAYCYFCGQDMGDGIIMTMTELPLIIDDHDYCYDTSCTLATNYVDQEVKTDLYFIERRELFCINKNKKREKDYN